MVELGAPNECKSVIKMHLSLEVFTFIRKSKNSLQKVFLTAIYTEILGKWLLFPHLQKRTQQFQFFPTQS